MVALLERYWGRGSGLHSFVNGRHFGSLQIRSRTHFHLVGSLVGWAAFRHTITLVAGVTSFGCRFSGDLLWWTPARFGSV